MHMAQPIHADKVFEGGEMVLDFNSFDRCTFNQSTLVYHGCGPTELANCSFNGVLWKFAGGAAMTTSFLTQLYASDATRDLVSMTLDNIRKGVLPDAKPLG